MDDIYLENICIYLYIYYWKQQVKFSAADSPFNYSWSKEEKKHVFNTNYHREMKLVPINMDYCLLLFDAFKFSLGGHLHEGPLTNFNLFIVNPKHDTEIVALNATIA